MAYDPIIDSNDIGRKQLVRADTLDSGPLIIIKPGECYCGCHERPARKRLFKPGHDTLFRAILQRAQNAEVPVTLVNGGKVLKEPAEWWVQWLGARKEADAVRRREIRRVRSTARFMAEHDGKVAFDIIEELVDDGMDAAEARALVLQKFNHYERLEAQAEHLSTLDAKRPKRPSPK